MLRLTYANRSEALADALAGHLRAYRERVGPLAPIDIVVPNRNLERYLELALAERLGIAANLRFHRLERFVARVLADAGQGTQTLLDRRGYEDRVLRTLLELPGDAELAPVARYVQAAGDGADAADARRVQLALRMAQLFESYAYARPELLDAWRAGRSALPAGAPAAQRATERWQRALWQAAFGDARDHRGAPLRALPDAVRWAVRRGLRTDFDALPDEVHVFGLSYVARVFQWVFGALGTCTELRVYVLNPCMEFWEDLPSESELRARAARFPRRSERLGEASLEGESHPRIGGPDEERQDDPPLLTYWGRPGREHVHLLNELTGAVFDARFEPPSRDTVLHALQRDILERQPLPALAQHPRADGSLVAIACPGVRREAEIIAERIWSVVEADATLRFNEIAVFVHPSDRDLYLPHLASVFDEAHRLPHNVVDLPLEAESRIVEAALLLLDLPFGRFRRPEVLPLLTHPALRVPGAAKANADRRGWVRLIERLGIFHGLDHADHEGTYIDRDLVNWDQGALRLVLGQWMTGEASGDLRALPLRRHGREERYLPAEAESDELAASLALLIRSLIADVRFARHTQQPLRAWATFFSALFRGYLAPFASGREGDRQEAELRRCLGATTAMAPAEEGPPVSYRVAAELLRTALKSLGGSRGEYLADGVVVSALAPMRAIPFRHIFVLGLGEGRFPTSERRDPLDLRAARRRIGDVTPAERDKYVFLEALLCARDGFVASWVARDPLTGDPIEASPVVRQLLEVIRQGYVADADALVEHPPLRRHEGGHRALPGARAEAHAVELGRSFASRLGRPPQPDELRALAEAQPALARTLGHVSLPGDPRGIEGPIRLTLARLRNFLEAPMQAWARAVLRIEEESDGVAEGLEDEPLAAGARERTLALRTSFLEALRRREPPLAPYDEAVERMQAQGQWPVGLLSEREREANRSILDGWRRAFGLSVRDATMTRVRFGASMENGEADVIADPLRFSLPLGPEGRTTEVLLEGRTEGLFDARSASLILVGRQAPVGINLQRERLRHALRGFFDHLALSASQTRPPGPHRALVLYGGQATQDASTRFAPVEPEHARVYLGALIADLLGNAHDYFLPCEAVFRDPGGWVALSAGALARQTEAVRRAGQGLFRFGPVPRADRYPALPADEALERVRERFGLFFRLAGLDGGE